MCLIQHKKTYACVHMCQKPYNPIVTIVPHTLKLSTTPAMLVVIARDRCGGSMQQVHATAACNGSVHTYKYIYIYILISFSPRVYWYVCVCVSCKAHASCVRHNAHFDSLGDMTFNIASNHD